MKIIFAGTPVFASVALQRLHAAGFEIALVLSQPDRPAGRGMKLQASPVKQFALEHHIPVAQPRSLRLDGKYPEDAAAARQMIESADADAMVVAAYGLILPQWVLNVMGGAPHEAGEHEADRPAAGPPQGGAAPSGGSDPRKRRSVGAHDFKWGCLNIHASLLPRWRGAAPIHRAIEAGDAETGVTIMQMDAGLDTGDMLLTERLAIGEEETTASLHDRLAELGGRMIVEALELAACGGLRPVAQPAEGVTYAHKIEKAEALIDWRQSAIALARRVRAFDPFPGASFVAGSEAVKLWSARAEAGTAPEAPGTVLTVADDGIRVQTGDGVLALTALQRAGGKRLPVGDFLRGFTLAPGQVLSGAGTSTVVG
ncbi:MAG: methionyl-tRNA formyltransferase [Betaproteobacteria bacterium HGW-Betaproteobacteria-16]|nr:MAG: methionyl-tRNA formyltransferase [Betaproteobacteria bacterium HGW-Betaproteobacteria-16]